MQPLTNTAAIVPSDPSKAGSRFNRPVWFRPATPFTVCPPYEQKSQNETGGTLSPSNPCFFLQLRLPLNHAPFPKNGDPKGRLARNSLTSCYLKGRALFRYLIVQSFSIQARCVQNGLKVFGFVRFVVLCTLTSCVFLRHQLSAMPATRQMRVSLDLQSAMESPWPSPYRQVNVNRLKPAACSESASMNPLTLRARGQKILLNPTSRLGSKKMTLTTRQSGKLTTPSTRSATACKTLSAPNVTGTSSTV